MSETSGIVKMLMALGVVFLLVGLLIPGQDAPWTALVNDLASQRFPTFDNPFAQERYSVAFPIVGDGSDGPASAVNNDAVTNCTTAVTPASDWWGCVLTQDGPISYDRLTPINAEFRVQLGSLAGPATTLPVLEIKIVTQCRAITSDQTGDYIFRKSDDTTLVAELPANVFTCPHNSTFQNVTTVNDFDTPYPLISDFNAGTLTFNPVEPLSGNVDYSFVEITVIYGAASDCTSADSLAFVGCIAIAVLSTIIKIVRFAINLIILIFQIAFYILSVLAIIVTGMFSIIAFLFAIPGAPLLAQGAVDIALVGMVTYMLLFFIRTLRGGSGI